MRYFSLILIFLLGLTIYSQEIVTTTNWVAGYVTLAGEDNVYTFTPPEMVHPPEYELKPGDIVKLQNAKLIIYAGYETMVKEIKGSLNIDASKLLPITTGYDLKTIDESVLKIAKVLGKTSKAEENLALFHNEYREIKSRIIENGLDKKGVLVDFHMQSLAKEMGLNVIGVFGPGPLTPQQLVEFKNTNPAFIIDNLHATKATALQEILPQAKYVVFMNFPGQNGTISLLDVVKYNMEQIK
ncbi:MAG: ABC transporter substrate-binding protein [Spirochaetales bacterium]|nr:ABC transporter substrate-binding protein [Spirochaetales bacterium]